MRAIGRLTPHATRFVVLLSLALIGATAKEPAGSSATELNNQGVMAAQAGRWEEGVQLLRRASSLDPADATARKNLSGVLMDWARLLQRQGRVDDALASLQEAIRYDDRNGLALVLLGDLLYLQRSEMPAAIRMWQRAHGNVADAYWPAVADRISQAQRDQLIERGFAARETAHFEVRFQESQEIDLSALAQLLEQRYAELLRQLGEGPSRVTVIVYTDRDLHRTYYQRDWALGFYDGRLRLRADDLVQPYLGDVVAHELAHAFLHHRYRDGLPIWVHEGFAQLQERTPPSSPDAVRIQEGLSTRRLWVPLKWLDQRFERPSGSEDIARAYLEARMAIRELFNRHGVEQLTQWFGLLATGTPIDAAYDATFAPSRWSKADVGLFE